MQGDEGGSALLKHSTAQGNTHLCISCAASGANRSTEFGSEYDRLIHSLTY